MPSNFQRGAFLVYPPGKIGYQYARWIRFAFNPEGLMRSLALEAGEGQGGEAAPRLEETLTLLLRFDMSERTVEPYFGDHLDGLRVEMAALEQLLYPHNALDDYDYVPEPTEPRSDVILAWSPGYSLPVRVLAMKFDELQHNYKLAPTRVEVEIELEVVLDEFDIKTTLGSRADSRRRRRIGRARRYYGIVG